MNDLQRLINYYGAGRLLLPRPRYLCVNATLRCDGRCAHCGIWKQGARGPEISGQELEGVLSNPLFQKVETAWITGGEPTLRDDLNLVARAMVESLPSLSTLGIATNALHPQRVLDRITQMVSETASQGVFVHLSLDGAGEVHDRVRRREGAFQAVSETIEGLLRMKGSRPEKRIEIGINCVVQPGNVSGLYDLWEYARGKGIVPMFNPVLVTDQVYRNLEMGEELRFSYSQVEEIVSFLDRIMPQCPAPFAYQYGITKRVLLGRPRPRRCLTLYTTVNINADATLIPCPAASDLFMHSVLEEDPAELWRSREAMEMRKWVEKKCCPACTLSCSLGDSMPLSEWLSGGWDN